MEGKARDGLNTQIYEEACTWFVEFRGGQVDAAQRRKLDSWLRKSPEHLRAYLEIAAIWNDGPSLDPAGKWDTETLLAQAAGEPDNVVPHPGHSRTGASPAVLAASPGVVRGRTGRVFAIAASVLLACAGVGAWLYTQQNVYVTQIGEQRSIRLEDGSTVNLNSRSEIRVRYSEGERAVELLQGQALFQVAKNAARPFVVTSGDTRVRAVGTQFDVNRRKEGTIVTVLEGRVAVSPEHEPERLASPTEPAPQASGRHSGGEASVYLSAGEQVNVATSPVVGGTGLKPVVANVAAVTAWTHRQLVFESATLAEVAEEFNRYNERQLTIEDAGLYDFHISGVFSSVDSKGLLDFLRSRPGVEVTETATGYRVARKSPTSR